MLTNLYNGELLVQGFTMSVRITIIGKVYRKSTASIIVITPNHYFILMSYPDSHHIKYIFRWVRLLAKKG